MTVTVSAPGKIHLMGEHAVVYGKPALLAAINLRLFVTITKSAKSLFITSNESPDYISHALDVVRQELKLDSLPSFKLNVVSQIPAGYHLGSSAAIAVATVGATMYYLKKIWNPERINKVAYEVEKKQHGNPSGGDNTTVTFGGFIWFRKELEFLKSIWQLPFKPHPTLSHFFLIRTSKPKESTGEMVALVKLKVKNEKSKMMRLFNQNEEQVRNITLALKEGDEKELLKALIMGEHTLEGIGVVSRKVVPLIRSIEKAGGAAKILGGGGIREGVGFLLCYHRQPQQVAKLSETYGYKIQKIILGEEGVRLEKGMNNATIRQ